jgi:hypothetical protein
MKADGQLLALAEPFLLRLNDRPEAAPYLAAYDIRIQFTVTDGEPFHAVIEGGRITGVHAGPVEGFSNRDDIELFGAAEAYRLVLERRLSPATAMFYGKLTPRGERAKHNQAVLAFRLLRIAQEPEWITEL